MFAGGERPDVAANVPRMYLCTRSRGEVVCRKFLLAVLVWRSEGARAWRAGGLDGHSGGDGCYVIGSSRRDAVAKWGRQYIPGPGVCCRNGERRTGRVGRPRRAGMCGEGTYRYSTLTWLS